MWRAKLLRESDCAVAQVIAVKVFFDTPGDAGKEVWDDQEVSLMLTLTHERLVRFIGAGTLQVHSNFGGVVVHRRFMALGLRCP